MLEMYNLNNTRSKKTESYNYFRCNDNESIYFAYDRSENCVQYLSLYKPLALQNTTVSFYERMSFILKHLVSNFLNIKVKTLM